MKKVVRVREKPTREEVIENLEGSVNTTTLYMHSDVGSVSVRAKIEDGKIVATFCAHRTYPSTGGSIGREDIFTVEEAVDYMLGGPP